MRLIIIDSDEHYLHQFREVVSKKEEEKVEVITLSSIQHLNEYLNLANSETSILIHEDFLDELLEDNEKVRLIKSIPISILSEGDMDLEGHYFHNWSKNFDFPQIEILIHKYQPIQQMLIYIKDNYLKQSKKEYLIHTTSSQLICHYTPYGSEQISKELESILSQSTHTSKKLIIHYDPFYEASDNQRFNLSYLFTQIRRGKENLRCVIKELVKSKTGNLDILYGPLNMLDIDCLSEIDMQRFLKLLHSELDYQFIVLNLNGCHISKHCQELLKHADVSILGTQSDQVQLSVTRQFDIAWSIDVSGPFEVLKEVICHGSKHPDTCVQRKNY